MIKQILLTTLVFMGSYVGYCQQIIHDENSYHLTMDEALELAQLNSIASQEHSNTFTSSYWSFRSYQASRLPSLNVSGYLGGLNHSLVQLQDATTSEIYFQSNYSLSNQLQLSIDQAITATGGTISVYSSLQRLDQFGNLDLTSWYSQPISISYLQPIFSYNSYKWDKLIEPQSYERAKKQYLENMENVTYQAVYYYWQYAQSQYEYDIAAKNFQESKALYSVSQEKFMLGTVTKSALLQLELKVLNDSLAMNSNYISLISTRNSLTSYIGLKQETDVVAEIDFDLPELTLSYVRVLSDALSNSSFTVDQQIQMLESERTIAQAKGEQGMSVSLSANFGLSNSSDTFPSAYRDLRDQEVVGLSLSIPIYDWGLGKGKVQMAKAQSETLKNQLEQSMIDYEQDIFLKVMQFNNQLGQCLIAKKAVEIAQQSYALATENFLSGSMTVTDLNAARSEYDTAQNSYVQSVSAYWQYFYDIRRTTLHDYILDVDINAEFDNIIKK